MSLTAKGTEEIVSTRSKAFRRLKVNIDEMSLQELYELIYNHPEILRKPIIIDRRRIQVGIMKVKFANSFPKRLEDTNSIKQKA